MIMLIPCGDVLLGKAFLHDTQQGKYQGKYLDKPQGEYYGKA